MRLVPLSVYRQMSTGVAQGAIIIGLPRLRRLALPIQKVTQPLQLPAPVPIPTCPTPLKQAAFFPFALLMPILLEAPAPATPDINLTPLEQAVFNHSPLPCPAWVLQ